MMKLMLACCKVYISESRNRVALEAIERSAKLFPEAPIVNKFEDEIYNRVGYTLVSKFTPNSVSDSFSPLKNAVFAMVKSAFETLNLDMHSGTHPRLGVVDHICFHPLGNTSLEQVACTAKYLASDVSSNLQVPTFVYGAAHQEGKSLDSIRRELGYFKPNVSGNQWAGALKPEILKFKLDKVPEPSTTAAVAAGARIQETTKGAIVIGATKWIDNYNIPIFSNDMNAVRRISKKVSSRGGGLPSVQSMALAHGDGVIEVACNLLEPSEIRGDQVQIEVERLAEEEESLKVGKGYYTDHSQQHIIERFMKLFCSHSM